jgi:hypothetical protein
MIEIDQHGEQENDVRFTPSCFIQPGSNKSRKGKMEEIMQDEPEYIHEKQR